ncbi:DUF1876 domain-containing protein [Streptomyces olivoreticuli]|uniref:DUF1876 domain-containing protein n=1 Tax=Streptomyces blastmyceticus TaxID=68180 RepID=A0ABN0WCB5_9ACTN|nr:DUF1876 domain-containing protein [Streptomyces olivoreticuli]WKK26429.1 DUF1876 domain-containing protein [Streptomyces olivoreticuli]
MSGAKLWTVEITIEEHDHTVTAEARLTGKKPGQLVGEGTARCHPADENVPEIGDELAVARALSGLTHQLVHSAVEDIEAHTQEHVTGLDS